MANAAFFSRLPLSSLLDRPRERFIWRHGSVPFASADASISRHLARALCIASKLELGIGEGCKVEIGRQK